MSRIWRAACSPARRPSKGSRTGAVTRPESGEERGAEVSSRFASGPIPSCGCIWVRSVHDSADTPPESSQANDSFKSCVGREPRRDSSVRDGTSYTARGPVRLSTDHAWDEGGAAYVAWLGDTRANSKSAAGNPLNPQACRSATPFEQAACRTPVWRIPAPRSAGTVFIYLSGHRRAIEPRMRPHERLRVLTAAHASRPGDRQPNVSSERDRSSSRRRHPIWSRGKWDVRLSRSGGLRRICGAREVRNP